VIVRALGFIPALAIILFFGVVFFVLAILDMLYLYVQSMRG